MNSIYILVPIVILFFVIILFVLITSIDADREERKRHIMRVLRKRFNIYDSDKWLENIAEEILNEDA